MLPTQNFGIEVAVALGWDRLCVCLSPDLDALAIDEGNVLGNERIVERVQVEGRIRNRGERGGERRHRARRLPRRTRESSLFVHLFVPPSDYPRSLALSRHVPSRDGGFALLSNVAQLVASALFSLIIRCSARSCALRTSRASAFIAVARRRSRELPRSQADGGRPSKQRPLALVFLKSSHRKRRQLRTISHTAVPNILCF